MARDRFLGVVRTGGLKPAHRTKKWVNQRAVDEEKSSYQRIWPLYELRGVRHYPLGTLDRPDWRPGASGARPKSFESLVSS